MNQITQEMRNLAKQLLEEEKVQLVMGWEKGSFCITPPCFCQ